MEPAPLDAAGQSRRKVLQAAILLAGASAIPVKAGPGGVTGPADLSKTIDPESESAFFGVKMEERPDDFGNGATGRRVKRVGRDDRSYYRPDGVSGEEEPHSFGLTFEIGNHAILASIGSTGRIANPIMHDRMVWTRRRGREFEAARLVGGSAWNFALSEDGAESLQLHLLPGVAVGLIDSAFPVFRYEAGRLRVAQLVIAPEGTAGTDSNPRALLVYLRLENASASPWSGAIVPPAIPAIGSPAFEVWVSSPTESPHPRYTEHPVPIAVGSEAAMCLTSGVWNESGGRLHVSLAPGEHRTECFALLLGSDAADVRRQMHTLAARSPDAWLATSRKAHRSRYGTLRIAGEGAYYADFLIRLAESERTVALTSSAGELRFGGFLFGSSYFSPDLVKLDHAPLGQFASRHANHPTRESLTQSLVGTLGAVPWIGLRYRLLGDADKQFSANPALLEYCAEVLGDVAPLRDSQFGLIPSLRLWDGPTRGDFHTGSNIVAWLAFDGMARLAEEVYGRRELAQSWRDVAGGLRGSIERYCVGASPIGPRYFEGVNRDGSFEHAHDGEEAFTSLAAYFGFLEPDDPAMANHARMAFTADNPLYAPGVNGIWWDGPTYGSGTTIPGQMASLLAVSDERELADRLDYLRRVADLDGSLWWWPYRFPCTDPRIVTRRGEPADVSKCDFAASVFVAMFVSNVLGIVTDAPRRLVRFRPFTPWPSVRWENARVGEGLFDFTHTSAEREVSATVTNRTADQRSIEIALVLPASATGGRPKAAGISEERIEPVRRFGRTGWSVRGHIAPGATARLEIMASR
jgi:hypothetical protein